MKKGLTILLLLIGATTNSIAQNGHLTWHAARLHNPGNVVQMLNPTDASTVWGLAYTVYGDTATSHRTIGIEAMRSTDGGRLWQSNVIPGTSLSDSAYVSNFWPIDSGTAYLALFNAVTSSGGKIMKTSNSGASWRELSLPGGAFAGGFLDFVYFSSPDTGLAVGDPNGGAFEIYTTSDSGHTWARVSLLDIPASVTGEAGLTYDFTFTSDSFFFVSTAPMGRRLYSTGDGGRSWSATPANATAYIQMGTQTNNGQRLICPFSFNSKTYFYSNGYGQLNGEASYGTDTAGANVTFGSVFRTRADNTYITEKIYYSNDTLFNTVDSFALYMCDGSQAAPFNWVSLLTTNARCNMNNAFLNYFQDQNNGWLIGDLPSDTVQIIWHYQNCSPNPTPGLSILDLAPGKLCTGTDTINLNHYGYATPPGGMYVINLMPDSLITSSLIASSLPYPLWIYYDYADPTGCEAQIGPYLLTIDTTHTAPALSRHPSKTVCSDAAPLALGGITPSGGYFYGNAVANDTFYPAQAVMGTNYAIYQFVDTVTQCANKSEFEITVENCTGISSPITETLLSLYPNPTSGIVTVESASPILTIQVLNVLGEVLMDRQHINTTAYEMSISALTDGTYMISVETVAGKIVKRLVKM